MITRLDKVSDEIEGGSKKKVRTKGKNKKLNTKQLFSEILYHDELFIQKAGLSLYVQ